MLVSNRLGRTWKSCLWVVIVIFTLPACVEDKCKGLVCANGGICVDGACACAYGYEGAGCNARWYEKFTGTWHATEYSKAGAEVLKYEISLLVTTAVDTMLMYGFADSVDSVICTRKAYDEFTILGKKPVDTAHKYEIKGGTATLDSIAGTVTGQYSFTRNGKDTLVHFKWNR